MRKYLLIFLIALAVLGITARAFCYPADVVDISGAKYFPAVKEALAKAKKSIYLVMFTIELSAEKQNSKANQLINTIIEAKTRGVDVEVVLDQNVDFVQRKYPSDWEIKIKSTNACKRLKEAGVKVYYDDPVKYVHAKAVVIDKKTVILGSTNWTEAAFDRNIEVSVLIESKDLAQEILNYFKTIKKEEYVEFIGKSTPISRSFLEGQKIAPLMVKNQAERAFDVYLYLLWKYSEKQGDSPQRAGTVPVLLLSYDDLAKHLGIYEGWDTTDYRRQIIKVLRELEQEYKLIKFEPRYAKEAAITLLRYEIASPRQAGARNDEEGDYFEIPYAYFDYGWNQRLSFRAKFCLLINLANTGISDIKPYWSKSVASIAKQFGGISQGVIHEGMGELRREKLLEVKYDELAGKPYEARRPKMYKLLKLYDPKELEAELKAVEEKYGREPCAKARKYAQIVFEENNPEVIEDIILKTKQYGAAKVSKAFGIVSRQSVDNPKRMYGYVVGILERMKDAAP